MKPRRPVRRAGARLPLAAALLAGAVLSGCGGDDSGSGDPGDAAGAASGSPSSATDADGLASESAEAEVVDYLPVPAGVELTEPGTELSLKQQAVVAWEPRQDLVGVVELKVKSLEKTSFEKSFSGWKLDKATRKTTPYFVRAKLTNTGDTQLGGRKVPLYADTGEALIEASTFETRFEPCASNGVFPKKFGPDDSQELCLVYLVPPGGDLAGATFRQLEELLPITWSGEVEDLTAKKKDKKDKKGKPGKKRG